VTGEQPEDERAEQEVDDVVDRDARVDIAALASPVPQLGDGGAPTGEEVRAEVRCAGRIAHAGRDELGEDAAAGLA